MTDGVTIDIPCDVQQVDGTGFVWMFLDEARDPARIPLCQADLRPAGCSPSH